MNQQDKKPGDDPADKAAAPVLDHMDVRVMVNQDGEEEYKGISGWEIDSDGTLYIKRRDIPVVVFPKGCWVALDIMMKFDDGSWIDSETQGGAPEEVGLGVEVTAIGGRTS